MKGLLLKDYYLFKKRCLNLLLIVLIFSVFSILNPSSVLFTMYPCLIVSTIPMTFISYDVRDKWSEYAFCLPYSKKEIVCEKYLAGLILTAIMIIITVAIQVIYGIVTGNSLLCVFDLCVSLIVVSLISPALMLPFIFKFGVEKGRIAYYFIMGGACAMIFLFSSKFEGRFIFPDIPKYRQGLCAIAVSAVAYILSVMISVKLYKKNYGKQ